MCSHVALTRKDGRAVARELEAEVPADFDERYKARDKIGPQSAHWLLRAGDDKRVLAPGVLGLSGRVAHLLINARAETVHRLPAFRDAFAHRRCLIPADAFYEWTGEKATRRAVRFRRHDGGLLLICALYEEEVDPKTGGNRTAYVILTTRPNGIVAPVKERMPVLLPMERVDEWLRSPPGFDPKKLTALLVPAPDDLLVPEEVLPKEKKSASSVAAAGGPEPE